MFKRVAFLGLTAVLAVLPSGMALARASYPIEIQNRTDESVRVQTVSSACMPIAVPERVIRAGDSWEGKVMIETDCNAQLYLRVSAADGKEAGVIFNKLRSEPSWIIHYRGARQLRISARAENELVVTIE